jgi:hypothetical protein
MKKITENGANPVHVVFKYLSTKLVAKFLVPDWRDEDDSGIGLSYCRLVGLYDNPMPEPTLYRQSGTMNLATAVGRKWWR